MRRKVPARWALALTAFLLCSRSASTQDQAQSTIYSVSTDVTAPVLLPSQPQLVSNEKCKKKNRNRADVAFSLYVTSEGKPRRITFLSATGTALDELAYHLASQDQFTPGKRNGESVPVWQTLTIEMDNCVDNPKDPESADRLIAQPRQTASALPDPPQAPHSFAGNDAIFPPQPMKVGNSVSAPVPLSTPQAHYSDQARKKRITGVCVISLIVDEHGMPVNPRVVRSLGYGLDENAIAAVNHYRFKPALRDRWEPVPVMLAIEVNFRLY